MTYWEETRPALLAEVDQLTADDAHSIVRQLVRDTEDAASLAPMLAGLVKGTLQRRDDERRKAPTTA